MRGRLRGVSRSMLGMSMRSASMFGKSSFIVTPGSGPHMAYNVPMRASSILRSSVLNVAIGNEMKAFTRS